LKAFKYFDKICFVICFFYLQCLSGFAQDQRIADSLVKIYQEDQLEGSAKLELLGNLSFNEVRNLELAIKYADELIALSKLEDNYLYLYRGYHQKGNANRVAGNPTLALEAFFMGREAAIKAEYIAGEGFANMAIADMYSVIGNSRNAQSYYDKAIQLLRMTNDSVSLGTALYNAGDHYVKIKSYDLALQNFEEAEQLFKNADYLIGTAYTLGNIGKVYAQQGKDDLAKANISEALKILEEFEDYYAISEYLVAMSDIYAKQNDWTIALDYAHRSLRLAQKYGLKKQVSDTNLKLSELYKHTGNYQESNKYLSNHIVYRDSVPSIELEREMANLRHDYEVSQKQVEVDLLNQQKRNQKTIVIATIIALLLLVILAYGLYRRYHFIKETNIIIEEEKDRSENLLLNILPKETAQELKQSGKVKAQKFESITVLFTDFEGFTGYAENLSPEKLVQSVDYYFSEFDKIMEKHNLEKIKTIGDSYMCAGGLHYHKKDHAIKMVLAAFEIVEFVNVAKKTNFKNETRFDIRIGINTGSVVAGVVGTKKFAYDIWGDTVNIASRMESSSESGKINVSEYTYELIKGKFDCEYRGTIEVKNRGVMKMYFVNGIKL